MVKHGINWIAALMDARDSIKGYTTDYIDDVIISKFPGAAKTPECYKVCQMFIRKELDPNLYRAATLNKACDPKNHPEAYLYTLFMDDCLPDTLVNYAKEPDLLLEPYCDEFKIPLDIVKLQFYKAVTDLWVEEHS